MLGSTMASNASKARGRSLDTGASTPTVLAATRNVAAWAMNTTVEATTIAGSAFRRSTPLRMSVTAAFQIRVHLERLPFTLSRATTTIPRTTVSAATATKGMDERTGDGRTRRTEIASTTCTNWPAARSHTTALIARPTSLTSRP